MYLIPFTLFNLPQPPSPVVTTILLFVSMSLFIPFHPRKVTSRITCTTWDCKWSYFLCENTCFLWEWFTMNIFTSLIFYVISSVDWKKNPSATSPRAGCPEFLYFCYTVNKFMCNVVNQSTWKWHSHIPTMNFILNRSHRSHFQASSNGFLQPRFL